MLWNSSGAKVDKIFLIQIKLFLNGAGMDNRQKRTGRKVRKESLLLDRILREEIRREFRKVKVLAKLCEFEGWSRSDYDRIMKWVDGYNKRVEIGLLIDALEALGFDWKEIFERAYLKRKFLYLENRS